MKNEESKIINEYSGLTKREYFAGVAMQGLISNPNVKIQESDAEQAICQWAIYYADELLKQLEK